MGQLSEFLDTIWGDTDGYVCIALKEADGTTLRRVSPKWPERRKDVEDFILAQTAKGLEVYITPALWKEKAEKGRKLSKDLFLCSRVLWVDMDGNAPQEWPWSAPTITPGSDESPSAAESGPPEPTLRVQSSTEDRQHIYWLLDEPITDVNEFENYNRTLQYVLEADPGGWDATQLLRPPETTNYGYGKSDRDKAYPVHIDSLEPSRTYSTSAFRKTKDFRPMVERSLGKIPDLRDVLAKGTWSDAFWTAFNADPKFKKRSDQLQEIAYFGAEADFTDEEIYCILDDADNRWKKYTGRTDRHKRLVDIIERARAKHPVGLDKLTFAGLVSNDPNASTDALKTLYTYAEFMEQKYEFEWLIEDLMPTGTYGIIAGSPGIGKTQLALQLGSRLLSGDDWIGWKNPDPSRKFKILLFSLEMPSAELQPFLTTMAESNQFMRTGADRMFIVPVGDVIPLDKPSGQKFFEAKIKEVQPTLVIIDSLAKSMVGSFKSDEVILPYNAYLNSVRKRFGCAIITVHHNRKVQDRQYINMDLDDLYGSRYIAQDAAFVLMLAKNKKGQILLNPAKTRYCANPGPREIIRSNFLTFEYMGEGDFDDNTEGDGGSSSVFDGLFSQS